MLIQKLSQLLERNPDPDAIATGLVDRLKEWCKPEDLSEDYIRDLIARRVHVRLWDRSDPEEPLSYAHNAADWSFTNWMSPDYLRDCYFIRYEEDHNADPDARPADFDTR